MKSFHLTQDNYALWALESITPRMYTFANYVQKSQADKHILSMRVNHYPARLITFVHQNHANQEATLIHLRSDYRGVHLNTIYCVVNNQSNTVKVSQLKQSDQNDR